MAPGLNTYNPKAKEEWQAAYAEGFEAGKQAALKEIKYATKGIERMQAFSRFAATATNPTVNK